MSLVYLQNYYRGANGALIFVDLRHFKKPDDRRHIIQCTKKLIQDLEENIGIKLPCLLVGAMVNLIATTYIATVKLW